MTAQLTVIYWRDIPAQVVAKRGRTAEKVQLPGRFQVAIDRAAMHAGRIGTDEYLDDWRRESRACGEDLAGEAQAEAERLVELFSSQRLKEVVDNSGFQPEAP